MDKQKTPAPRAGRNCGWRTWAFVAMIGSAALGLVGCGGSGGGTPSEDAQAAPGCTLPERRTWLADQFRTQYFYNALTSAVDPVPDRPLADYFTASLFTGNERLPADRFSYYQSSASFTQFFGEGRTLGFGLAVAGQEVQGQPFAPLYIRDVTPASPADTAGLRRGDRVLQINGRSVEDLIAAFDFSALTAQEAGQSLQMVVQRGEVSRTVQLQANVHDVVPVRHGRVISLPDGRKVGLVRINSMITLANADLTALFEQFRDQAVSDVIMDLRYNGGGAVSVGARLASLAAGTRAHDQVYAVLRHNEQQQGLNQTFRFNHTLGWRGVNRVYVLAGSRTCSASEQVISGLRGVGIEVVVIGSTTCGKPVGFRPREHCGQTFSLVNFDSINARGDGEYYRGLAPSCAVAESFTKSMEDPSDALVAAALQHAQGRGCPAASGPDALPQSRRPSVLRRAMDGPEGSGLMLP